MAGDRVLLNIDAKADQAIKEVEKLRKRLEKVTQEGTKTKSSLDGAGSAMMKFAAPLTGILSTATLVSGAISTWEHRLDRAQRSAGLLVDRLREAAGGAGALDQVPAVRQMILGRQGAMASVEQDVRAFQTFTGAAPGTGSLPRGEQQQLYGQVLSMSEQAGIIVGDPSEFVRILGRLVDAGVDPSLAGDIAITLVQQAGSRAQAAAQVYTRLINQVPGQEIPLLQLVLAFARSDQQPEALNRLVMIYLRMRPREDIFTWFQTFNAALIGEQRGAVTAAQGAAGGMRGLSVTGALGQQSATAMAEPLMADRARIMRAQRGREVVDAGRISGQLSADARLAEGQLRQEQIWDDPSSSLFQRARAAILPGLPENIQRAAFWMDEKGLSLSPAGLVPGLGAADFTRALGAARSGMVSAMRQVELERPASLKPRQGE